MVCEEEDGWKEQAQSVVWVDVGIINDASSTDSREVAV
jgi:hypothetical protein